MYQDTGVDNFDPQILRKTLLGLFLNADQISGISARYSPQSVLSGTTIFEAGTPAKHLYIVIAGSLQLFHSDTKGQSVASGTLLPLRSANLYSVVRGLPYQYTGVAAEDSRVISIPWHELENDCKAKPGFENYLRLITESPVVRMISKDLMDLGCSDEFRVFLLGHLNPVVVLPQTWLAHENDAPDFAFILTEGSLHAFRKKDANVLKPLWQIPKGGFQLLKQSLEGAPSSYSVKSSAEARILKIQSSALLKLRELFPEDFDRFNESVTKSSIDPRVEGDEGDSDVEVNLNDVKSLFPKFTARKIARKYPFVGQYDEMDCGPACLAMISKYFGAEINIQYWRQHVSTNQEGTALFDLAKGAERNGFICHGIGTESLDEIGKDVFPIIAIRKGHYLVVYQATETGFWIGDPAIGLIKMPEEQFYDGFENAVLLIKPSDSAYEVETLAAGYSHYWELFSGLTKEMALVFACSIVLVALGLFVPILTQIIFDEVLVKKDFHLLGIVLAAGGIAALCRGMMLWLRGYYITFVIAKFDFKVLSVFWRKMFSLPYSYFATRHTGDFTRRIAELERLRMFMTNTVLITLLDLFTVFLYSAVLCFYSLPLAMVTFMIAPAFFLLSWAFSSRLKKSYQNTFVSRSELEGLLTDSITGVSTIKTLGAEVATRWRLEEALVKSLSSSRKFSMLATHLTSISATLSESAKFLLLGLAAYLGIKGELSQGQIISLMVIVAHFIEPFSNLAHSWANIQETKGIMERLNDILLSPSESFGRLHGALKKDKLRGTIEFQDVWFRYGGESSEWVLKGVSFALEPGQKLSVVGPSGSGKSTLVYLLARIYEPTRGQILIDGRDYREYDIHWLRSQLGLLLQEPHLFRGSIRENIAWGTPLVNDVQVQAAAVQSDAHKFISEKSIAYSYVLSHGGIGLSGGEKQKLSLARLIYAKPSILLLDEATASLDGISERNLMTNIKDGMNGNTVISIAHRFSTARMFDLVLVMNEGKVAGLGTHQDLSGSNPIYQALFELDDPSDGMTSEELEAA